MTTREGVVVQCAFSVFCHGGGTGNEKCCTNVGESVSKLRARKTPPYCCTTGATGFHVALEVRQKRVHVLYFFNVCADRSMAAEALLRFARKTIVNTEYKPATSACEDTLSNRESQHPEKQQPTLSNAPCSSRTKDCCVLFSGAADMLR